MSRPARRARRAASSKPLALARATLRSGSPLAAALQRRQNSASADCVDQVHRPGQRHAQRHRQQRDARGATGGACHFAPAAGTAASRRHQRSACACTPVGRAAAARGRPAPRPRPSGSPAGRRRRLRAHLGHQHATAPARRWSGRGCRWARRPGSAPGSAPAPGRSPPAATARPTTAPARDRPARPGPTACSRWRTRAASGRRSSSSGRPRCRPRSGAAAGGRPGTRSPSARGATARGRPRPAPARRSSPGAVTLPRSGCSSPAMQFSSVDLPTPDSPSSATNSPRAMCNSTPPNTGVPAKDLLRPCRCSMCTDDAPSGRCVRAGS
jgi:hypothetical protein